MKGPRAGRDLSEFPGPGRQPCRKSQRHAPCGLLEPGLIAQHLSGARVREPPRTVRPGELGAPGCRKEPEERPGGEEPGRAGARGRPREGAESGQRRLRSRWLPSRTRAEGAASGPLSPAVGRGHRALGWKGASPPHSSVLPGGAFSGTTPHPPLRALRLSGALLTKCAACGVAWRDGGAKKERSPQRGEDVCYSLDPGSRLARLGGRFWPPKRGRWWPGCSARPRTTRSAGVGWGQSPLGPPPGRAEPAPHPSPGLRSGALAYLKPELGPRSRGANSWKVPGKRPPPQPGGALRARPEEEEGGGEHRRRVGPGSRAHTPLRGRTFNSCQVWPPPPRLAGLGFPRSMSLLARRLWRSAGRGQGAPGLRAPRLRTLCARSRDAGGARAGAGGRYGCGEPRRRPNGVAGEGSGRRRGRRAAWASAVRRRPGRRVRAAALPRCRAPRPALSASFPASGSLRSVFSLLIRHPNE